MIKSSDFFKLSLPVFTIGYGLVEEGTTVVLRGKDMVPTVVVGSGQQQGAVPVLRPPLVPCPERGKRKWVPSKRAAICKYCGMKFEKDEKGYFEHFDDLGFAPGKVKYAEIEGENSFTLIPQEEATTDQFTLIVFRTSVQRGGGNAHTGDKNGWMCSLPICHASSDSSILPQECPNCGTKTGSPEGGPVTSFSPFPGRILAEGRVHDPWGGGSGSQIVAVLPKNAIFRIASFGNAGTVSRFYLYNGVEIKETKL